MAANYSDEEEDDIIHIGEIKRQKDRESEMQRQRQKDRKNGGGDANKLCR